MKEQTQYRDKIFANLLLEKLIKKAINHPLSESTPSVVFLTVEHANYGSAMDKTTIHTCSQSIQRKRADKADPGCKTSRATAAFSSKTPKRFS